MFIEIENVNFKTNTNLSVRNVILIFFLFLFTVRPLSIKLVGENRPLSAEVSVNISCRVIGAKPTPIITWWKDDNQMKDAKQIVSIINYSYVIIYRENGLS